MDGALENPVIAGAEGARCVDIKTLRQKDREILFFLLNGGRLFGWFADSVNRYAVCF